MNKRLEKNFGITLIALIVTIIVLLILSGVAIATLTGENGLFARAKQAKQTQIESEMKEKLNLSIQELQVEKLTEASLDDITQEWLTQKLSEYNPILKENETVEGKKVTLQKNGIIKTYLIDINLNITEVENESGIEFSYEIVKRENGKVKILIKVQDSENGINKVEVPGDVIILGGTREQKGIDQEIEVGTEYKFKVISTSGKEREETILIEPEIIVGEAYIGTSTTETDSTKSVPDNSQTKGTTLYINFKATLEKFGTACTVKLKDGTDSDTLPYAITKNGTYTFVVTGTYGDGKIIAKEVDFNVNTYQVQGDFVQYDAGEWTIEEIQDLKKQNLYMLNKEKDYNSNYHLEDNMNGLNFTFGGFTYKEDTQNEEFVKNGIIITSRNQSVVPRLGGTPKYSSGWQVLSSKVKEGKTYITKLVHSGSPENFVFYGGKNDAYRALYLLNGDYSTYNKLSTGKEINLRNWNMYKDKNLDAKGYISGIHIMNYYYEALDIANSKKSTNSILNTGIRYFLASAHPRKYSKFRTMVL